jgi:hypothetical protein
MKVYCQVCMCEHESESISLPTIGIEIDLILCPKVQPDRVFIFKGSKELPTVTPIDYRKKS